MPTKVREGPLSGLKVVEFAGLAPGPFAGLILSDFGASITRIDRFHPGPSSTDTKDADLLCRGKRSIAVNLKTEKGLEVVKRIVRGADVVIDPFRPGVLERMGLGPEVWLGDGEGGKGENEGLVFARLAGFRTDGPHKDMAGHDINYLALSGVLSMFPGTSEKPSFPLNLLADFAGGGLTCAMGIMIALFERSRSGRGQVVNTDMVSGTRYLSTFPFLHSALLTPIFSTPQQPRQTNVLDGGAPFYNIYTCKDGRYVSVGCLEPRFFKVFWETFLTALGEEWVARNRGDMEVDLGIQGRKKDWELLKTFMEKGFRLKGRDEWATLFYGTDACVVPVLTPEEAAILASRSSTSPASFGTSSPIPNPAPFLSRTPALVDTSSSSLSLLEAGEHTYEVLRELGIQESEVVVLVKEGVVGGTSVERRVEKKAKL